MHNYKNGREAKDGDYVIGPIDDEIIAGKIGELTGKAVILYPVQGRTIFAPIDPEKFLHADDAMDYSEKIDSLNETILKLSHRIDALIAERPEPPVIGVEAIPVPQPEKPATVTEPAAPVISTPTPGTVTAAPKEVASGGALSIAE